MTNKTGYRGVNMKYEDIRDVVGIRSVALAMQRAGSVDLGLLSRLTVSELYELEKAGAPVTFSLCRYFDVYMATIDQLMKVFCFYGKFDRVYTCQKYRILQEIFRRLKLDYCEHVLMPTDINYSDTLGSIFARVLESGLSEICRVGILNFMYDEDIGDISMRQKYALRVLADLSKVSISSKELHSVYHLYSIILFRREVTEHMISRLSKVVSSSVITFDEAQSCSFVYLHRDSRDEWYWLREALLCKMFDLAGTLFEMRVVSTMLDMWYQFYRPLRAARMRGALLARVESMSIERLAKEIESRPVIVFASGGELELRALERCARNLPMGNVMGWLRSTSISQSSRILLEEVVVDRLSTTDKKTIV
jgi:hypothetical protein